MKITCLDELPNQSVSHNREIQKKVMIAVNEIPHLTNFSQATFTPGQKAIAHAHDTMYEIFYIESGAGLVRVNGVEYAVKKGSCLVIEPKESHEVINNSLGDLVINVIGIATTI
jgi:mannose-6-phosphate isomerase-like protein (cupin superfamily)